MSDRIDPIEIPVVIDDSAIVTGMSRVGKQAETMGRTIKKDSAVGIAGMRGLEVVAADAGRAFGITGESASVLGRAVGSAAKTIGGATIALGGIMLAAYAAKMAYDFFVESSERAREATLKSADSAMSWVDAARVATKETDSLRDAKDRLWQAEKRQAELDLQKGIKASMDTIEGLYKKADKIRWWIENDPNGGSILGMWVAGTRKTRDDNLKQVEIDTEKAIGKLHQMYDDLDTLQGESGGVKRKPKGSEEKDRSEVIVTNQYEREAAYQEQLLNLYRASSATKEEIWRQELAAFDWATKARMANAQSEQEYYDILAQREMERATKVANHDIDEAKRKAAEKKAQEDRMFEYGVQIAIGLTELGAQHGKKDAEEQKKAARMIAIVNTAASMMRAYREGGWYAVAAVAALGAIQIAKINSASYGSGGGGGMTMGGQSVSGGQDNYRYFNYEQSTYGTGWRPSQGQGQTNITINAVDSKSFTQLVNENPTAITSVVEQKQKGYL